MVKLSFVLSLFITSHLMGQTNAILHTNKDAMALLNTAIRDKREVYLSEKVNSYTVSEIRDVLARDTIIRSIVKDGRQEVDTIIFTVKEKQHIDLFLNSLSQFRWKTEMIGNLNLSIRSLVNRDTMNGKEHDGKYLYSIMPPIFLRNGTIAISYFDYVCGGLCGYGTLAVYRKVGNEWRLWWELYHWNS